MCYFLRSGWFNSLQQTGLRHCSLGLTVLVRLKGQIIQHLFLFFQSSFSYIWLIILRMRASFFSYPIFGRSSKVLIETMITIDPFSLFLCHRARFCNLKEGKQMYRVNPEHLRGGRAFIPNILITQLAGDVHRLQLKPDLYFPRKKVKTWHTEM